MVSIFGSLGSLVQQYGAGTQMVVGGVTLKGAFSVNESAGMNAPTKKTEQGFEYASHVDSQPLNATIQAWVTESKYNSLAQLRDADEPFNVTVGVVSISKCKLNDLSVDEKAEKKSHLKVSIKVQEVREPSTGTATLVVEGSGSGGTQSGSSELEEATLMRPSAQSNGNRSNAGGMDPLGDIAGWLGW